MRAPLLGRHLARSMCKVHEGTESSRTMNGFFVFKAKKVEKKILEREMVLPKIGHPKGVVFGGSGDTFTVVEGSWVWPKLFSVPLIA